MNARPDRLGLALAIAFGMVVGAAVVRLAFAPPPGPPISELLAAQNAELVAIRAELRQLRTTQNLVAMPSPSQTTTPATAITAPTEVAPAAAPTDPKAIRALENANRLVDDALRAGRWTERDVNSMRNEMNQLDDDERYALRQRIIIGINRGELKADPMTMHF